MYLWENCIFLQKVDICNLLNVEDDAIKLILQNCRYLQSLNISGCTKISSNILIFMLNNCKKITNLKSFLIMNCPEIQVADCDLILINDALPELTIYFS